MSGKLLQLQKRTMTLAGSVMTLYLLFHVLSNLTFFSGEAFNRFYAVYNLPWIRWPIFAIVLAALVIHIKVAITLRIKNSRARQQGYKKYDYLHIPAALVTFSITLLFVFIVVHIGQALLLDTTDIKAEVTNWFSSPWLTLVYLMGIIILAMHLQHSLVNVMQTLGVTSAMYRWAIISGVVLMSLGFAAIPVASWVMQ